MKPPDAIHEVEKREHRRGVNEPVREGYLAYRMLSRLFMAFAVAGFTPVVTGVLTEALAKAGADWSVVVDCGDAIPDWAPALPIWANKFAAWSSTPCGVGLAAGCTGGVANGWVG